MPPMGAGKSGTSRTSTTSRTRPETVIQSPSSLGPFCPFTYGFLASLEKKQTTGLHPEPCQCKCIANDELVTSLRPETNDE